MQMTHTRIVPAPPQAVFDALVDPVVLKDCVPGCESLDKIGDNSYHASVMARVGPVSARFSGKMTMEDIDPPRGYTLKFEGQGGAAGFANGDAKVTLEPAGDGQTTLAYTVNAKVGGKLAQIGSRLVDGAAAKLADDFFTRFVAHFAAPAAGEAAGGEAAGGGEAPGTDDDRLPVRRSEMGTWTRFIAIGAIIAILAYLYFRGGHFR